MVYFFRDAGRSAEVAHLSWAQGVAGSTPVAPTIHDEIQCSSEQDELRLDFNFTREVGL